MPELPEVETTRRGLEPHLAGRRVTGVTVRNGSLRWPVEPDLVERLVGARLKGIGRRAKYLLFNFNSGTLLVHLGMSGSLRLVDSSVAVGRHDHVDIVFHQTILRLNDPRRFGAVLWAGRNARQHPLLANLGVEPLGSDFTGHWLYKQAGRTSRPVKHLIMDQKILVGVGNIYACEALFRAGLHPERRASDLDMDECRRLVAAVKAVLEEALDAGGTTLKDFTRADGRPGYFSQSLAVYGRAGQPCTSCYQPVAVTRMSNRSTFFCPRCQR
ncbi:MAG: bifunctional DNA-formamidopyrimidine glycosylase/DNA-(apurinic or apyrimidinic site) lyase [Deltaproteobacteria bacterium]|nr:MAG: bifunctional DNA-formamidopyrimidine glycosylase/DNA-(apurinic or apyrimidinic site) lyase [Deltaproteobacteria bacterium]